MLVAQIMVWRQTEQAEQAMRDLDSATQDMLSAEESFGLIQQQQSRSEAAIADSIAQEQEQLRQQQQRQDELRRQINASTNSMQELQTSGLTYGVTRSLQQAWEAHPSWNALQHLLAWSREVPLPDWSEENSDHWHRLTTSWQPDHPLLEMLALMRQMRSLNEAKTEPDHAEERLAQLAQWIDPEHPQLLQWQETLSQIRNLRQEINVFINDPTTISLQDATWMEANSRLTALESKVGDQDALVQQAHRLLQQLKEPHRPAWASAYGSDDKGIWADLQLRSEGETLTQRMRWIFPGRYLRGSSEEEAEASRANETQHAVILTRGYWIADTPCTQALWQAVMGNNPSRNESHPQRPVERVSWEHVQEFLRRLNAQVPQLAARLPSEAEWEYAARAGATGPIYGELDAIAWYRANSQNRTQPVASREPNAWGLYDVIGNVWEWCSDWYGPYPSGEVVDPQGPDSGTLRVIRGGSWYSDAQSSRLGSRDWRPPTAESDVQGFRIAISKASETEHPSE